jgi:hypothetical protein
MGRTSWEIFNVRRALVLNPLFVGLLAVLGWSACRAGGINPHSRSLAIAAAVGTVAAEAAMLPLLLTRGADQATVSQAALAATVVHMLAAAGLGGGASVLLHQGQPFLYWLLAFYWLTLVGVCIAAVATVKLAPPHVRAMPAHPVV